MCLFKYIPVFELSFICQEFSVKSEHKEAERFENFIQGSVRFLMQDAEIILQVFFVQYLYKLSFSLLYCSKCP